MSYKNSCRSVKFHACQGYKYLEPQQATSKLQSRTAQAELLDN